MEAIGTYEELNKKGLDLAKVIMEESEEDLEVMVKGDDTRSSTRSRSSTRLKRRSSSIISKKSDKIVILSNHKLSQQKINEFFVFRKLNQNQLLWKSPEVLEE